MSISVTPISSSNYSTPSLLNSQESAQTETDAAAVQTLTHTPSDLLSISQAGLLTNVDQAVKDSIIQNDPTLAQNVSSQSGSSGSSSSTPDAQGVAELEASLANTTAQPSSDLASYPTDIDQAVQDATELKNNPYAQFLLQAPGNTGSKLNTVT